MSLNSQLSKEARLVHKLFSVAAQRSSGYGMLLDGGDPHVAIAGGAIRDVYFERATRDIDIYYNTSAIPAADFACALKGLNIQDMAKAAGFDSIVLRRLSDGSLMGIDDDDEEDYGDVSDHEKQQIRTFVNAVIAYMSNGMGKNAAISHTFVDQPQMQRFIMGRARVAYAHYLLDKGTDRLQANQNGSAGGSKMGKAHPLKSVEQFRVEFNGTHSIDIELMGVAQRPVEYVMTHFAVKLSRAHYDGHRVHFTSDFLSDARNKTITVACPIEHARFERLFSYYLPKMKAYFPDFEIKIDLNAMNS